MNRKILIVEDDPEINKLLQVIATKLDIQYVSAYSGSEAVLQLNQSDFDLVLLDLMLPGMDGKEVLQTIREKSQLPVIVISAKNQMDLKIEFLRLGADDYITKPFNQDEVAARIEVQLRKISDHSSSQVLNWRNLELNIDKRSAKIDTQELKLTNAEFDVLVYFVNHPDRALSKKEIYEAIWKGTYVGDDNTISVHVSNLRKKIQKLTSDEYVKTVWGIGFMLI